MTPGNPAPAFDPGFVQMIVGIVLFVSAILVAFINKAGNRRTQTSVEMAEFIKALQTERAEQNKELNAQRDEIRQLQNLVRADFQRAMKATDDVFIQAEESHHEPQQDS